MPPTLGQRWFARVYAIVDRRQRPGTAAIRRQLVGDLAGAVIEVGVGPGANFEHYSPAARVLAVDDNERMLDRARGAAVAARATVELRHADALALPFPDEAFDAHVATLVLCSVADLDRAVDEAWRVLRPGGEVRLFEHVRSARRWRARVQSWANPIWGLAAGGCHLDRDPVEALARRGFALVDVSEPDVPRAPLRHVVVRARKPVDDGSNRRNAVE